MDAKTLEALEGSIKKWEAIVAGTGKDEGPSNCPLCLLFWELHNCAGCPVFARTGNTGCRGPPYDEFENAEHEGESKYYLTEIAQRELAFLKSIRPSEPLPSTQDQR